VQLPSWEMYLDSWVKIISLMPEGQPYIGIFLTLTLVTDHLMLPNFYDS